MDEEENKKSELSEKDLTKASLYCQPCGKYFRDIGELRKHIVEGKCVYY